ncbi:MAG: hypothetical protein ACI4TM_04945 [Candidatus Cryptobacteroides sp.]
MKKNLLKMAAASLAVLAMAAGCTKDNSGANDNDNTLKDDEDITIDETLPESLKGKKYAPIALDEESAAAIKDRVVTDLYVNGSTINLWVWNGYEGGVSAGLNFYGYAVGQTALTVNSTDWSGAGWCVADEAPVESFVGSDSLNDWYFHMGYYTSQENKVHLMSVVWAGQSYVFAIGQGTYVDKDVPYQAIKPVGGSFKVGEWNEYEICLADMGLDFSKTHIGNYLTVVSGNEVGTTFVADAIFFYKK